jgi:hypothetical protein
VAKRSVAIVLWATGAALIAAGIAFSIGWKMGFRAGPSFDLFSATQFGNYVSAIRQSGTDAAYEEALRAELTLNEQLKARDPNPSSRQFYDFDSMLTLVRLSEVAKKRGAEDQAIAFSAQAELRCAGIGIRNCSRTELLRMVRYSDGEQLGKRDYE